MKSYPKVLDPNKVGEYAGLAKSGGGYVWDEVLEYRVWCHPHNGAPDLEEGILQREYIDEPSTGQYKHVKEERITEWPVQFLERSRRSESTIPNFMSVDAPENKLDIIRGIA